MKKILLVVLFITIAVSFYACKDKRDLSPSGIPDTQMSAVYLEKASFKSTQQGSFPICIEYWFEGTPEGISQAKKTTPKIYAFFGGKLITSCKEYRQKATCACKQEQDTANDNTSQRMWPNTKKFYSIQYFLGKDKASAKRVCDSKDKYKQSTFVEF